MTTFIFGIITTIIIVTLILISGKKKRGSNNTSIVLSIFIGGLVFTSFTLFSCIKVVHAGEVGIVYDYFRGGVQKETLSQGMHFRNPFVKIYKIDTTQQKLEFAPFNVQTQDSEFANFTVEIKYRVPISNANKTFLEFKGMPKPDMLQTDVQSAIKEFSINYNIYGILGGDFETLRTNAYDDLKDTLDEFGIEVIELNFKDIDAGDEIEKAIIQKGIIKQEKDQAEEKRQVAEIEQQRRLIEAETSKQEVIKSAEAEAEKMRIKAEAESEAIRLIQEQLSTSPSYIDYIKWSNWDGKLPEVIAGDSANMIIDTRSDDVQTP